MSGTVKPFDFLGHETTEKAQPAREAHSAHLPETTSHTSYAAFPDEEQSFPTAGGTTPVKPDDDSHLHKDLVQALYIGIFAIAGTFLRMIVAQVFGEYCKNPDSIGWLKASAPLCVTNGVATEEGGIIFADLPANMLGCFIMGLFQNGAALGLALPLAIAWLLPYHTLQEKSVLHKGITTGFCGSLTTFSGWNSAMVVLLFGTGQNRPTHVFNAICKLTEVSSAISFVLYHLCFASSTHKTPHFPSTSRIHYWYGDRHWIIHCW